MNTAAEPWKVLIVRHDGSEIFLNAEGGKFSLPRIVIPARQRIAANINRAVERELELRVVSLYEISPKRQSELGEVFYHATAVVGSSACIPESACWKSIAALLPHSFSSENDFAAVNTFVSGLDAKTNDDSQPFLEPRWFRAVTSWVEDSLHPYSRHLTGSFEQFNASSTFSLIRFETDDGPVWFKAVGEPNLREFPITLALGRACPAHVPRILANNTEWNAWLADQASGQSLSECADISRWEQAARSLAHLQIHALSTSESVRQAGARDLRPSRLVSLVEPFFEFIGNCTSNSKEQTTDWLGDYELRELRGTIEGALVALERLSLPEGVGHMDLNPQNIFCSATTCVFLDWAETFVGCPFFSFEYLLQQFRRSCLSHTLSEEQFRHAYFEPWQSLIPSPELEATVSHTPLAALFAYATTLCSSRTAQRTPTASQRAYLASLTRRMWRITTKPISVCS